MAICSKRMQFVNSDIRGKNYLASLELEKKGEKILKLNTGNPATFGFEMPESVIKALSENLSKSLGYSDIRGMLPAREAIFNYHAEKGIKDFSLDDIFIGNGVSEIASMVSNVLFEAGDEVLCPTPCYSLWNNEILLRDAKPVFYRCDEENGWNPDVKHIESLISDKTKAILIINPNNPTGALYSDEILKEIVRIAEKHDLVVLSDEIYDRLLFDGATHTSTAVFSENATVITMNGLSKSHCLCGFRCGWMVISGPFEKRSQITESLVKLASVRLCPNAIMQTIIPAALADTEYTEKLVSPGGRLYEQRKATFEALDKAECMSYVKNTGSFYVFPKIIKNADKITDDRKFTYDLLMDKHILVVPGSGFLYDTPDHFRIVMLPEPDVLGPAVTEIADFIENL